MNFLQIVQRACSESGIVPGEGRPASVSGASGIEAKFCNWVASSWSDIQSMEPNWFWLRREFDGAMVSLQMRQNAASLGASRFRSWMPFSDDGIGLFTIYDPALGRADEGEICFVPYSTAVAWDRGVPLAARPSAYSIDHLSQLVMACPPDKAYRLRGTYNRSVQVLTKDSDTPECPPEHHELIVYRTLVKQAAFDVVPEQMSYWMSEHDRMLGNLRREQLPDIRLGGPLA